jgi:protein arginine N-methyltransferase 1
MIPNQFPSATSRPSCPYTEEQLWLPLSLAVEEWGVEFHRLLCADRIRVNGYKSAIDQVVSQLLRDRRQRGGILTIMDVGTGSGVLCDLVISAWDALYSTGNVDTRLEIIALEGNQEIARLAKAQLRKRERKTHGALDASMKIRIIQGSSYDVCARPQAYDLTRGSVDLILCEMMGNLADNEDMVCVLRDITKAFLVRDGIVLPTRLDHYLVPVSSEALWNDVQSDRACAVGDICATFNAGLEVGKVLFYYDAIIPDGCHLADEPIMTGTFDFRLPTTLLAEYTRQLAFTINRPALLHGFKSFFLSELAEGIVLDTGVGINTGVPPRGAEVAEWDYSHRRVSDCWKHGFIPLSSPLQVRPGDRLKVLYSRIVDQNHGFSYRISGGISSDISTDISHEKGFEQSIFFKRPFSDAFKTEGFKPKPNDAVNANPIY